MSLGGALAHQARLFFVALQFLTRLPVPQRAVQGFEPVWLNRCVGYFPLVGVLVGAIGAIVLWLASLLWPAWLAALLAVGATVWVTGAFHEDGLADTFDALGGTVSRERALAIMKDSRIGSYGATALTMTLALRVAALATLAAADLHMAALALVAAHTLGRSAAVGVMCSLPYAGDAAHAKARPLVTGVSPRTAALAAALAALMLGAHVGAAPAGGALRIVAATLGAVATAFVLRRWFLARLGGYTGDTLGAIEQLTEVVVLLTLCLR